MGFVRVWAISVLVVAAGSTVGGCRSSDRAHPAAGALQQILAGRPPMPVKNAAWADVREFYKQRAGAPAWITETSPSKRTAEALHLLRTARAHGLAASDYGESRIAELHDTLEKSDKDAPNRLKLLADFEARVTTALLALGRDVALGRTTPAAIDRRWKARRKSPDFVGTLSGAVKGDLDEWLESLRPRHPEYAALQKALMDMGAIQERGAWPKVPAGTLKPGQSHPAVVVLRRRLAATGELKGAAATSASSAYDKKVEAAVNAFQEHHAFKASGIADAATLAAMNVPVEDRIRQIALNLERWRWMPDDFGPRHLLVNIPYFHLIAREHGKIATDIRVVVGKPGNETPVFSSEMTTVAFSPYWNIPDTIVAGETAPAVARDAEYLARNNIEILRVSKSGAERVDPSDVDWGNADELRQLGFRQRPGAKNALGHVKFLFPNDYDVYLHDTPADDLFSRRGRAFSHGCVRVEEPETLAKYILRGYTDWDEPRIIEAMHAGVEKQVKLTEPIPVHIVYFTAWVDEAGGIHFQPDVYGYDQRQALGARH